MGTESSASAAALTAPGAAAPGLLAGGAEQRGQPKTTHPSGQVFPLPLLEHS